MENLREADRSDALEEAALWLLAQLEPDVRRKVGRRLALRLDPPETPAARYSRELSFVYELLRDIEPAPGWTFPHLPRTEYDDWRSGAGQGAGAPSSASLVARYGSWLTVCFLTYRLFRGERTHAHPKPVRTGGRLEYTGDDAVHALRDCARALNRVPTWRDYQHWASVWRQRLPAARYPSAPVVTRLYRERGGWCAALEAAGLAEPPEMTVRVWISRRSEARDLVAMLRGAGILAAPPGPRSSAVEAYAPLSKLRAGVARWAKTATSERVVLWEPATQHFEEVRAGL
jgi:hypothetical protein